MTFVETLKFENIYSLCKSHNLVFLVKKSKEISCIDDNYVIWQKPVPYIGQGKVYGENLFFVDNLNNYLKIFDVNNGNILLEDENRLYSLSIKNDAIICSTYNMATLKSEYSLFDFVKTSLLWQNKNLNYLSFFFDNLINTNVSVISKINESTGDTLWERELGSGTFRKGLRDLDVKISQLIGVWKNQLLIWMNNEQFICLDVNTGTELWRITDFINQFLPNWQSISQFSFVYCHIENGKLYQLDGDSYWSLDLATQEFELLWQDTQKEYLTIIHKTYTEDFIYFTASRNYGLVPYLIGVFNRKTLSIEWLHDARLPQKAENNFCNSLNQAPQVDGNRLYVLDSGGTLHIFEKESSTE